MNEPLTLPSSAERWMNRIERTRGSCIDWNMASGHIWVARMVAVWLIVASNACAEESSDWRIEILNEHGIPTDTAALEKKQKNHSISAEILNEKIKLLASEKFAEREQAQKDVLMMGKDVLPMILALPTSDDPEVRMRLGKILISLQADGRWNRQALVRRAIESLLHERKNPGIADPQGELFVECFKTEKASLSDGYRRLGFKAPDGLIGSVSNGAARFRGNHATEGDQRLILRARDFSRKQEFPDTFRIESKIGGAAGGQGTYHVGISIGNVRALFHPGYPGGAFRFERVDNNVMLVQNTNMGFNPPVDQLLLMSIEVKRLAEGNVSLDVTVNSAGHQFQKSAIIKAADIGKLETIGLDRSGRSGGDGLFDDFIVDFKKP